MPLILMSSWWLPIYESGGTKNEFFALALKKCRLRLLLSGAMAGVGVYVCLLVLAALPG
jgi:hypothetical protein